MAIRYAAFRKLIKSEPALLVYNGEMLGKTMKRERIAEVEIEAIMREHGVSKLENVKAIFLETEGQFSLIRQSE
jgi:uncharacterized membrane protein YcaP (DUF421 family)